jgi:hypothetical protein
MNRHADFETLQDYREGLLSPEEGAWVRAHLEGCAPCRDELEALSALMEGLEGLPVEAQPSRDLWPQIEWRIGTGSRVPDPGAAEGVGRPGRQVTLPAWQLLAASITLAIISGGVVWAALSGGSQSAVPVASAPAREALAQPVGWESALDEYDQAVADLEGVMEMGREVLDPETIRILEENLQAIDRAIQEAQEALAMDPGSRALGRFLAESLKRKIDLLRHAATAVYVNS